MNEFAKRLKEPSTATAIGTILAVAGMNLDQIQTLNLEQMIAGIGALILLVRGILAKEGQ